MKQAIAFLMMLAVLISFGSCASESEKADRTEKTTSAAKTDAKLAAHIKKQLADVEFDGIIYVTHNGKVVFQRATGKDENGEPLKIDTSMYIGSLSKQFCAAAVMILRDQGKLSVRDTVGEGFAGTLPEKNTEKQNTALIKKWIFGQSLWFEPGTSYIYSNSNYILLADIVEQVSGQYYNDFLREHIFEPLEMKHTGMITEVSDSPAWAENLIRDSEVEEVKIKGVSKGAGDIVSNAPDMVRWMEGLSDGKIVSPDTLKEMTKDYSPDFGEKYGYGLKPMFAGCIGHEGAISDYSSMDYFNPKSGYCFFCDSNGKDPGNLATLLLFDFLSE